MYGRPSCPPTLLHDVALSFIKDRTTEQTYPNGTDGSDQSSHSTLKPLHQPISPIPPNTNTHALLHLCSSDAIRIGIPTASADIPYFSDTLLISRTSMVKKRQLCSTITPSRPDAREGFLYVAFKTHRGHGLRQ